MIDEHSLPPAQHGMPRTIEHRSAEWLGDLVATEGVSRQGFTTLGVVGTSQAAKLLINIAGSLILVRILGPDEFGLAAMALVVVSILLAFKDMGLSTATTQMPTISHAQATTLFWINQLVSAIGFCTVVLVAPLIASLFDQMAITNAIRAGGLVFPLAGLAAQHEALLRRNLVFRALGAIEVVSAAASVATTVVLAHLGFGWWSLVLQRPIQLAIYVVGVWWRCSWRPSGTPQFECVRAPVRFGLHLTISNLSGVLSRTADNVAIGFFWGATPLGLYSKAYDLLVAPLAQLSAPVGQALQSTLSRLRSEPARYAELAAFALSASLVVLTPVGLLMVFESAAVTRVLLGDGWMEASTMVGWFGLAVCYQLAGTVLTWVLITQHRGREISRTTAALTFLNVASFVVAARFGPVYVAATYVILGATVRTPALFIVATNSGLFDRRLALRSMAPPVIVGVSVAVVYAMTSNPSAGALFLAWQLILGYLVAAAVLWRTPLGSWCRSRGDLAT